MPIKLIYKIYGGYALLRFVFNDIPKVGFTLELPEFEAFKSALTDSPVTFEEVENPLDVD